MSTRVENNRTDRPAQQGPHQDPSSTGAFILMMPTEILDQIFLEVRGPVNTSTRIQPYKGTLASLARTCKHFRDSAQAVLYQDLVNILPLSTTSLAVLRSVGYKIPTRNKSLGDFVQSADIESLVTDFVLSRIYPPPAPAHVRGSGGGSRENQGHVRPVSINVELVETNRLIRWDDILFQNLRHQLRDGLLNDVLQPQDPDQHSRRYLSSYLMVPFFLAALPKLVKCRLPVVHLSPMTPINTGGPLYLRRWMPFHVTPGSGDPPPAAFPGLRELEINAANKSELVRPDYLVFLFRNAPALSTLWLEQFGYFPSTVDFSGSRLISITFSNCSLYFERIHSLVASCRGGLQKLEIAIHRIEPEIVDRESLPHILAELANTPSVSTLRTLIIDKCRPALRNAAIISQPQPQLQPPLASFISLKWLSVDEPTLYHPGSHDYVRDRTREDHPNSVLIDLVRCLPGLETLSLTDIDDRHGLGLDPALRSLAEEIPSNSIPSSRPSLRRVRLLYKMQGYPPPAQNDLVRLFASVNIELEALDDDIWFCLRRVPFTSSTISF